MSTSLTCHHTANPFPVMTTGISLCTNSHREIPVMNTGSLQWQLRFPLMKTGFSLWELVHRENPVLALYWPCKGLQCGHFEVWKLFLHGNQCTLWKKRQPQVTEKFQLRLWVFLGFLRFICMLNNVQRSPHYMDFGSWKILCYWKFVYLSGTILIPHLHVHT